ncbi:MAG TPA: hypothetical protein VF904_10655 [Anaeromyxobacteraceae bacterium]
MLAALLALALSAAPVDGPSISEAPRFPSMYGGETLGVGGSEAAFSAGFSTFSASYAQGLADGVDYGAQLEIDWVTGELFAGGLYRSLLWRSGPVSVAARARAGLYGDFGATWGIATNRGDTGVQLAPGLALSTRAPRGIFSLGGDVPITLTFARGGGYAVGLRGTVAFETPLYGDLLVGARAGGGVLWSRSGAPFANDSPRATVDLSALLTYRLF